MKWVRNRLVVTVVGSALLASSAGVAVIAISSASQAVVTSAASCPDATHYDYSSCS
jgi:hypothetical protein